MISAVFGFDDLPTTELTCAEYEALWAAFNGHPRGTRGAGRLTPVSTHTTPGVEQLTAWGIRDEEGPALAEWVRTGRGCQHWLFAEPRDEGET